MANVTVLMATIDAGQSLSNALDCVDDVVVGLIMPPAWTSAHLTFSLSLDNITFYDLYKLQSESSTPSELVANVRANAMIPLHPDTMLMARYLKLRSGLHNEPVPQAAARAFKVLTVNRVGAIV